MKRYDFEYTSQMMAYLLFASAFASLIGCIYIFHFLVRESNSTIGLLILSFIVSFLVFWLNKGKIKKYGTAQLMEDSLELELDKTEIVKFTDLKYYYYFDGKNGAVFTLGFHNGKKIKIGANNNFCNDEAFTEFTNNLQSVIETFKEKNKVDIIHLKSVIAKKNSIYVLICLTIAVILGFCFTTMPLMIIPTGVSAGLLGAWIRYFKLKHDNDLTDI